MSNLYTNIWKYPSIEIQIADIVSDSESAFGTFHDDESLKGIKYPATMTLVQ